MTKDLGHFRGFGRDSLAVFKRLERDNTREKFLELKPDYERALRIPAMQLVADLNEAFSHLKVPLRGDPKRALFRPNRDIRFTRDKSPYKTNISLVMTRSGEKNDAGLLYFQLGLDGVFAALGFYILETADLAAFRQAIIADPKEWRRLHADLSKRQLDLSRDNAAKRLPRGIPDDLAPDLRDAVMLKSFTVSLPLSMKDVSQPALVTRIAEFARDGSGLLKFGWRALTT